MNDPALAYTEILREFEKYTKGKGMLEVFQQNVQKVLDDFYNDVYEEGFTDGFDQRESKANSDAGWDLQNARDSGADRGMPGDWPV